MVADIPNQLTSETRRLVKQDFVHEFEDWLIAIFLQIFDLVRFAELVCLSQELNIVNTASRVSVSLIDYALNKANLDVFNIFLPKNVTNSVKNLTLIGRLDF
jgi:hypothetical protein